MRTKKYYPVKKENIERFLKINETIREFTAQAEGDFFNQFKDLSSIQMSVIRIINYHHPCTMSQIAKSTSLTLGSITQIVDKLIEKKYAKRKRSDEDRRVVFAELTVKGKNVIAASQKHVGQVAEQLLSKFSESAQEEVLQFFQKIIDTES